MFPEKFTERLKLQFGLETAQNILENLSFKRRISVRVNTLKALIDDGIQLLQESGFTVTHDEYVPEGLVLNITDSKELTELDAYKRGKFYIQSLSSMRAVHELDPQPDETVLDLCAAPGSKTSFISARMKNTGEIVANDVSAARIMKLKSVNTQLGVENVITSIHPGQSLWMKYQEYFDRVLVDVPCSMEGRFLLSDPKSYAHWSPKKVKNLSKLQKWLLRAGVSATKIGGRIVYSTCTLSEEEDEKVVDWILKKDEGKIKLLKQEKILPSEMYDGFFLAVFEKIA